LKQYLEIPSRKRAIIYCRVSTDKQEQDGESLEYQEEKCIQYADLHDIDVILILKEAKSGFIHYSHREKLTIARQLVREKMADMIIVWDLRRFSRNFVHSAMIFEEVESAGGMIVSVSENIDNSLTGKLIRSIMAWSAESERNKIVEYANRRWQTRIESGLPVGTGRPPYGWDWKDREKTCYKVDMEEAAVRVSIFHMFVEMDMSLRAIAHKLTEDKILTPFYSKRYRDSSPEEEEENDPKTKYTVWGYTAIREILKDPANIGILVICKEKQSIGPDGRRKSEPHPNRREVPGGIPAIINPSIYERAQEKLKTHKVEHSHRPLNEEDFLLRGHISCGCCNHMLKPRTQKRGRLTKNGTDKSYPFYICTKMQNKYSMCSELTQIRTSPLDEIVWQECCQLFRRIDMLQAVLEQEVEAAVSALLEDTTGQEQIKEREGLIEFAKNEREKHPEGSYMHTLISQEEQLARFKEELGVRNIAKATGSYQQRVADFLEFLNVMRGRYEHATFEEKRNALEVLGVKVIVHEPVETYGIAPGSGQWAEDQEWFTAKEAGRFLGVHARTIHFYKKNGTIIHYREEPHLLVHRDELLKLQEKGFLQRNMAEIVKKRIEITYSLRLNVAPNREIPTGVQVSLQTRK
jgi:site-specific DNA recombinase